MKKIFATLCLLASTIALSACDTTGSVESKDVNVPYTMDRTASHDGSAQEVAPAEEVFQKAQKK